MIPNHFDNQLLSGQGSVTYIRKCYRRDREHCPDPNCQQLRKLELLEGKPAYRSLEAMFVNGNSQPSVACLHCEPVSQSIPDQKALQSAAQASIRNSTPVKVQFKFGGQFFVKRASAETEVDNFLHLNLELKKTASDVFQIFLLEQAIKLFHLPRCQNGISQVFLSQEPLLVPYAQVLTWQETICGQGNLAHTVVTVHYSEQPLASASYKRQQYLLIFCDEGLRIEHEKMKELSTVYRDLINKVARNSREFQMPRAVLDNLRDTQNFEKSSILKGQQNHVPDFVNGRQGEATSSAIKKIGAQSLDVNASLLSSISSGPEKRKPRIFEGQNAAKILAPRLQQNMLSIEHQQQPLKSADDGIGRQAEPLLPDGTAADLSLSMQLQQKVKPMTHSHVQLSASSSSLNEFQFSRVDDSQGSEKKEITNLQRQALEANAEKVGRVAQAENVQAEKLNETTQIDLEDGKGSLWNQFQANDENRREAVAGRSSSRYSASDSERGSASVVNRPKNRIFGESTRTPESLYEQRTPLLSDKKNQLNGEQNENCRKQHQNPESMIGEQVEVADREGEQPIIIQKNDDQQKEQLYEINNKASAQKQSSPIACIASEAVQPNKDIQKLSIENSCEDNQQVKEDDLDTKSQLQQQNNQIQARTTKKILQENPECVSEGQICIPSTERGADKGQQLDSICELPDCSAVLSHSQGVQRQEQSVLRTSALNQQHSEANAAPGEGGISPVLEKRNQENPASNDGAGSRVSTVRSGDSESQKSLKVNVFWNNFEYQARHKTTGEQFLDGRAVVKTASAKDGAIQAPEDITPFKDILLAKGISQSCIFVEGYAQATLNQQQQNSSFVSARSLIQNLQKQQQNQKQQHSSERFSKQQQQQYVEHSNFLSHADAEITHFQSLQQPLAASSGQDLQDCYQQTEVQEVENIESEVEESKNQCEQRSEGQRIEPQLHQIIPQLKIRQLSHKQSPKLHQEDEGEQIHSIKLEANPMSQSQQQHQELLQNSIYQLSQTMKENDLNAPQMLFSEEITAVARQIKREAAVQGYSVVTKSDGKKKRLLLSADFHYLTYFDASDLKQEAVFSMKHLQNLQIIAQKEHKNTVVMTFQGQETEAESIELNFSFANECQSFVRLVELFKHSFPEGL